VLVGTGSVLVALCLSDRVVLSSTLSTCQGAVTTGAIGVGLVTSVVIGVGTFASSARVGGELRVLGTEDTSDTTSSLPAFGVLEVGVAVGSAIRVSSSSRSVSVELVGVGGSTSGGSSSTGRLVLVGLLVEVSSLVESGTSRSVRVAMDRGGMLSTKVLVLSAASTEASASGTSTETSTRS